MKKGGLKITGIKQEKKYEGMERVEKNISVNLPKGHTILMFNKSSTRHLIISDKYTVLINPVMNIIYGEI